jgi:mono/diheme cytochrome c family protein
MRGNVGLRGMALLMACLASAGCSQGHFSGKPGMEPEVPRPEQVLDFKTLYGQNCAACHGENGSHGATLALANPVFLAVAGEANLQPVIAQGVPGKLMPAFAKSAGGMLTDQQVAVLAHGIVTTWGKADAVAGIAAPAYSAKEAGNAGEGAKAYATFCARCHGANGEGAKGVGSVVDAAYLGLVSDQYLRNVVIAGMPDDGMPDWRGDVAGRAMTEGESTDVVAWLGSHRTAATRAH